MSDHKRPHEENLSEADKVLLGLYDRSREPIAWDESDDAVLTAARLAQPGATDDLDAADKVLLELYERGKEPIPWDETDDAIIAAARKNTAANDDIPIAGSASEQTDLGDNVVRFPGNRIVRSIFASPATGWAIAASVVVGIFVGQGTTPYLHLGIGPDVPDLLNQNTRLAEQVTDSQSEIVRLSQQFSDTGIRFTNDGDQPGAAPGTDAAPDTGVPVADFAELGRILDQFECSALSATLRQGSNLMINGHVSSADDMNRLLASLEPYAAFAQVSNQAQIYAYPHCDAVEIAEELTVTNTAAGGTPSVRPFQHGLTYTEGEPVVIEAVAGAVPGYLYVDFIQNDGTIVHLLSGARVEPGAQVRLGETGLSFSVAPPFGDEMLLAIQTPQPLYTDDRPQVEDAATYLPVLRSAIRDADQTALSGFTFLTTGPAQ